MTSGDGKEPPSSGPSDLLPSSSGADDVPDNGPVSVEVSLSELEVLNDPNAPLHSSEPMPSEGWSMEDGSLAHLYSELTDEERAQGETAWWRDNHPRDRGTAEAPQATLDVRNPVFSPVPRDVAAESDRGSSGPPAAASSPILLAAPADILPDSAPGARDAGAGPDEAPTIEVAVDEQGRPRSARKSRAGRKPASRKPKRSPRSIPLPPPPEERLDAVHALVRTSKHPTPPLRNREAEIERKLAAVIDGSSTLSSEIPAPSSTRLREALVEPSLPPPAARPPEAVVAREPAAIPQPERKGGTLGFVGSVLLAAIGGLGVGYASGRMGADRSDSAASDQATSCPCLPGSAGARDRGGATANAAAGEGSAPASTPERPGRVAAASPGSNALSAPGSSAETPAGGKDPSPDADAPFNPDDAPAEGPLATAAPSSAPEAARAFDTAAASAALSAAAGAAAGCRTDSSEGAASVTVAVTFAPSGRVTTAKITGGQFAGTPAGGCIAQAFKSAHVPPFEGEPVTVRKTVQLK